MGSAIQTLGRAGSGKAFFGKGLPNVSLTGASAAKRSQKRQGEAIAKQTQSEGLRLAEAESEIGRAKLLRKTGGRRSLIASV